MRSALNHQHFFTVALAPDEIDRAYPLVAAVDGAQLSRSRWRAIAGGWLGAGRGATSGRGILTLRAANGTLHGLFFFEPREDDGRRALEVSRLRFVEVAGAHHTLAEILTAIDRLAAAHGCSEVRIALGDTDGPGCGVEWAVLERFAERAYRPRSALLFRSGPGDDKVIPLRR